MSDERTWSEEEFNKHWAPYIAGYQNLFWSSTDNLEKWARYSGYCSVMLGFLVTIIAAFPLDSIIECNSKSLFQPMTKWSIVIFSSLSTIVTASESRLTSLATMREKGRVILSELLQEARIKIQYFPMSDEKRAGSTLAALSSKSRELRNSME